MAIHRITAFYAAALAVATPAAAQTDIHVSRELPMLTVGAVWGQPRAETPVTPAGMPFAKGTILYEESFVTRQLAGSLTTPLTVSGITAPAGTVFRAWWIDGEQRACAAIDGQLLCLAARGGKAMDTAILTSPRHLLDDAAATPLAAPVTLKGVTDSEGEPERPLAGDPVTSFFQSGRLLISRVVGKALPAPAIRVARQIAVGKIDGSRVTLRCQDTHTDDFAKPVEGQSGWTERVDETDVDLAPGGAAQAGLCGATLALRRGADGTLAITPAARFTPWLSLDATRTTLTFGEERFVYGVANGR